MASGQRDHWFHVWLQYLLLSLFLCRNVVLPDNKNYHTSTLCLSDKGLGLYKKVDGAVVISDDERDMTCVVTFQTDSILQAFMLRFEHLALDCNDHLYIYDAAHDYGNYEKDLSCRNTINQIRPIFTKTNYVTLKYVTDNWSHAGNGFKLVITVVRKPGAGCKSFRCLNDLCISQSLTCDGVNHCGDNSDETDQALCGVCPKGFYGAQCAEVCKCLEGYDCNQEDGCIKGANFNETSGKLASSGYMDKPLEKMTILGAVCVITLIISIIVAILF